jgi:DNA sulfur modification protein DndE
MKKEAKKNVSLLLAVLVASIQFVFSQEKDIAYYLSKSPFSITVKEPSFPDKEFLVSDYGGIADGKILNTAAFSKAIDACVKAGGGRVVVNKGTWLTGPIELKSNVDLHLNEGALIVFTKDHTQFPILKTGNSSYVVASPIYAFDAKNIAITGTGIIDGGGDSWRPLKKEKTTAAQWSEMIRTGVISKDGKIWWPSTEAMNGEDYLKTIKGRKAIAAEDYIPVRDYLRPYMVYLVHCDNVLLNGVTLKNSPKFVFYPNHCNNLIMNRVVVYNDWWAQNGDGIDISACKNVLIYKCNVNAGDDGICMKSSGGKTGSAELENIVIAGCTVLRAHGGFVIGSNTDGGMKNIYVTDCNFIGTDVGVRVKSNAGRGGLVKDIFVDNITMKNIVKEAVLFTTYYEDVPAGKDAKDVKTTATDKIPEFTNFYISNIKCDGAKTAISITGLPQMPVHNIFFNSVEIIAEKGFEAVDARDIELKKVKIAVKKSPVYNYGNATNIKIIE